MDIRDLQFLSPIINDSGFFVAVIFPKRDDFITETQIISLIDFANRNNLSFIGINTHGNNYSALFRKNIKKANTENKPISQ